MRAASALLGALLIALPTFAGCLAPGGEEPDTPAFVEGTVLLAPRLDAEVILAQVKAFSEKYPHRRGDSDAHNGARAELLERFRSFGLETYEDEYRATIKPTSTPTSLVMGNDRLVNLVGFKWGTQRPEEWIVVGAHYDVTDGAVYGAYDDASGTWFVQALAEAFADLPTSRTIVFVHFDGEEQGLTGSKHLVTSLAEGSWLLDNGSVVGMIDFDMAGITYPSAPPLVADAASPEMKAVIDAKREALGIPADMVQFRPIKGGNSDNGPFKAAEIPSVLFISDFDEVRYGAIAAPEALRGTATYPFWHQLDTYEGMVLMAEGEANLAAGFQNVADIGSELLLNMATGLKMTFDLAPA